MFGSQSDIYDHDSLEKASTVIFLSDTSKIKYYSSGYNIGHIGK